MNVELQSSHIEVIGSTAPIDLLLELNPANYRLSSSYIYSNNSILIAITNASSGYDLTQDDAIPSS